MKRIAAIFAIAAACTLAATALAKTYPQTGQVAGSPASSVSLKVKVNGKGVIKKVVGLIAKDVPACESRDGEPQALTFEFGSAIPVDKKTKKFSGRGSYDAGIEGKVKKKGKKVTGTIYAPSFVAPGSEGGIVRCHLAETKFSTS